MTTSSPRFYNTLSRTVEEFRPIESGKVRMYHCGPTVYDYAHIGNLRAFVFADILRRMLEYNGYTVQQVMNITDVGHLSSDGDEGEDKMTKALRREGKPLTLEAMKEVADHYTEKFLEDLEALGIERPHILPKASEHVMDMIILIEQLEKNGAIYTTSDGVYFDVSKAHEYGRLAQLDLEKLREGARVSVNPEKRHAADFALWKFNDSLGWESPWGKGFPGWHIECSAMSMKYLGETFDIHTGGIDHIPVHHTNEIAQSETATHKPFAHYWLHNEFINIENGKMAKSAGNIVRLLDITQSGIPPLAYRYLLLTAHYRTPLTFSLSALENAHTALQKIYEFTAEVSDETGSIISEYRDQGIEKINDDLGTPEAIALIWKMLKDDTLRDADKKATLLDLDRILGLDLAHAERYTSKPLDPATLPTKIQNLMKERDIARENKDFSTADDLREELLELGYTLEDTAEGQRVFKK